MGETGELSTVVHVFHPPNTPTPLTEESSMTDSTTDLIYAPIEPKQPEYRNGAQAVYRSGQLYLIGRMSRPVQRLHVSAAFSLLKLD